MSPDIRSEAPALQVLVEDLRIPDRPRLDQALTRACGQTQSASLGSVGEKADVRGPHYGRRQSTRDVQLHATNVRVGALCDGRLVACACVNVIGPPCCTQLDFLAYRVSACRSVREEAVEQASAARALQAFRAAAAGAVRGVPGHHVAADFKAHAIVMPDDR